MVIDVTRTGGVSKSIRLFPGKAPRASSRKVPRPFPKYPPARYPVSSSSFLPQGTPSLPRASSRKVLRPFDEHPPATHLAPSPQPASPIHAKPTMRVIFRPAADPVSRFSANLIGARRPVQISLLHNACSETCWIRHAKPMLDTFALNRPSRPSKDTIATQSGGLERIRRVSPMRRAGRWHGRNECGGPVGGAGATGAACRSTMRGVVGGLGIADSSIQPAAVDPPARSATAGSSGRRAAADSSVRPAVRVRRTGRQQLIHWSVWQRRARRAQRLDAAP